MSTMTTTQQTVKPATLGPAEPDYITEVAERAVAAGTRALLERWQAAEPDFEDWAEYAEWSSGHTSLMHHLYALAQHCPHTFMGQVLAAAYRALGDAIYLTGSTDPAVVLDRLDALDARYQRLPEPPASTPPGADGLDGWPF